MSAAALEMIAQEIEHLGSDEKWALLSLLIESLRRQATPPRRSLLDYYGAAQGRGFKTVDAVDSYVAEERASWEARYSSSRACSPWPKHW